MFAHKILIVFGILTLSTAAVYAAPVDIPTILLKPTETSGYADNDIRTQEYFDQLYGQDEWYRRAAIEVEGDWLQERELDQLDAKAEGRFYTAGLKLPAYFLGPWDFYGNAGMTDDFELDARIGAIDVDYKVEDSFTWSAGATWIPFQLASPFGAVLFVDGKYRAINEADYDSVALNGIEFTTFSGSSEASWREWQAAIGLAFKFPNIVPYIGGKYSNVDQDTEVSILGSSYNTDTESENQFGPFAGVAIVPNDILSLNVQGRFVDEQAISAELALKF